jgi:hypothetical protein
MTVRNLDATLEAGSMSLVEDNGAMCDVPMKGLLSKPSHDVIGSPASKCSVESPTCSWQKSVEFVL